MTLLNRRTRTLCDAGGETKKWMWRVLGGFVKVEGAPLLGKGAVNGERLR
jgi:hypothetical protein